MNISKEVEFAGSYLRALWDGSNVMASWLWKITFTGDWKLRLLIAAWGVWTLYVKWDDIPEDASYRSMLVAAALALWMIIALVVAHRNLAASDTADDQEPDESSGEGTVPEDIDPDAEEEAEPGPQTHLMDRESFVLLTRSLIAPGTVGVHLATLDKALGEKGSARKHADFHGITVRRQVSVKGDNLTGIRASDLPSPEVARAVDLTPTEPRITNIQNDFS